MKVRLSVLSLLLAGLLLGNCGPKESVLIVHVTDWPAGASKLRVLPTFAGKPGQTFFVDAGTTEFSVYVPPGLAGQAVVEGMVDDGAGCYSAGQLAKAEFTGGLELHRAELPLMPYGQKQ